VKCTGVVAVLDEDLPVICRNVMLVRDACIACRNAEFQVEEFSDRNGKAVCKSGTPECELVATESVPLKVSVTAPDVSADEMAEEVVAKYVIAAMLRYEPVAKLCAE
jgi:hypothetical protein